MHSDQMIGRWTFLGFIVSNEKAESEGFTIGVIPMDWFEFQTSYTMTPAGSGRIRSYDWSHTNGLV